MIDAGIHADDVVVVEKRTSANVGDIVVAIVDNEFTLKRRDRERGRVACLRADTHRQMLKTENKAYLPARRAQAGPVIRPTPPISPLPKLKRCERKRASARLPLLLGEGMRVRAAGEGQGEGGGPWLVVGQFRLSACDAQAGKY